MTQWIEFRPEPGKAVASSVEICVVRERNEDGTPKRMEWIDPEIVDIVYGADGRPVRHTVRWTE